MIIGLSGYAQSGKDTVAAHLVGKHGFIKIAFADALRDALYALNPMIDISDELKWLRVKDIVDLSGWDQAKIVYPEIRQLLQRFGTEVGRAQWGNTFWIRMGLNKMKSQGHYVFTDCRFPDEAQAVKNTGGQIWRVRRAGNSAVNAHPSETSLDDWPFDQVIDNRSSLDELYRQVDRHIYEMDEDD